MPRNKEETEGLSLLGNKKTVYKDTYAPEVLETFVNKHQGNGTFYPICLTLHCSLLSLPNFQRYAYPRRTFPLAPCVQFQLLPLRP